MYSYDLDATVKFSEGAISFPELTSFKVNDLSSQQDDFLMAKYNLTEMQLELGLDALAVSSSSGGNSFWFPDAFADDVINYKNDKIVEISEILSQTNPSLWEVVSDGWNNLFFKIDRAIDKTKINLFHQSEPEVFEKIERRLQLENISFYDGGRSSNEEKLYNDPSDMGEIYGSGSNVWRPDQELVVVSYQDKIASMGVRFFKKLGGGSSGSLPNQEILDDLGNRFDIEQADANDKISAYWSVLEAGLDSVQPLINGEGTYYITTERLGKLLQGEDDLYRWSVCVKVDDGVGVQLHRVEDEERAKDLLRKAGIGI
ncbi:MAG: hypothetical protein PHQ52_00700 [Candidatus Omnitrophica bacterium]|nr:hypothetical protein [Candidatus Omnitrophota bacterium]